LNERKHEIECCDRNCYNSFEKEEIERLLFNTNNKENDDLYIRYLEIMKIWVLNTNPLVRWCPKLGCGKFVRGESKLTKKVTCECGQEICFKCGR
jgi:E3 ubiquitin-protein ligase RNF19A